MTLPLIQQFSLSACLREVHFRQPLIKNAIAKAAYGPETDARYQLSEGIRHAKELLGTLEREQLSLGWRDDEGATA